MGHAINRGLELGKIIQQKNGESAGGITIFTQMLRTKTPSHVVT